MTPNCKSPAVTASNSGAAPDQPSWPCSSRRRSHTRWLCPEERPIHRAADRPPEGATDPPPPKPPPPVGGAPGRRPFPALPTGPPREGPIRHTANRSPPEPRLLPVEHQNVLGL